MDIATFERAAETILAGPNLVSPEERRNAEQLFQELKKGVCIADIKLLIQSTQNQFLLFQVAQSVGEVVLKQWSLIEGSQIEECYKMVLQYVAENEGLTSYVVAEFLRAVAMILKRGVLDKKSGNQEELLGIIRNLLSNESPRMQAIGCQLISSITEQFSSPWRNAEFAITWDFHVRAKAEFEKTGLRSLLEMSLETLDTLCNQPDILNNEFNRRLCDKFLEVAENIFSWNFSARILKRLFALNQSTNSFRPPGSWSDLLHNERFFPLFFQLHSRICADEALSSRSLSCLIQLTGLSGECMNNPDFVAQFNIMFVQNLLNLFKDGPLPHEVHNFCTIINRLFLFRPVHTLMRLPADLRSHFFNYLSQYIQHLTGQAMTKAIGSCEHEDHASLALLLDSWSMMLRGRWRSSFSGEEQEKIESELMAGPTCKMVHSFILAVQAAPLGSRPVAMDEDEEGDEEKEDRTLFADLLRPLSTMISYNVPDFLSSITQLLHERLSELQQMEAGSVDISRLPAWQEDMHWIMLVLANSVALEDEDGSCCMAQEIYDYSIELCKQRGGPYSEDVKQEYLAHCIANPTADRPVASADVDPTMILLGEILAWSSLEHRLLSSDSARHLVSPELTRSSLVCLKRFINAISHVGDSGNDDPLSLPVLHPTGPLDHVLTRFCLEKVFAVFQKFGGEPKLCRDAVDLLTGLIDSRAAVLASAPELFEHLQRIEIPRLPSRSGLMKSLVQIAAAANEEELQRNMYERILAPLAGQFAQLCSQPSSSEGDSQLVDLLQCFDGVAQASCNSSAATLSKFLHPLLRECVPLMKSRAHCTPLISSVLHLLHDVTTKVSIYLEDQEESTELCRTLMEIVNAYRSEQKQTFIGMTSDDEDKAADLVLFMDILSNVLSKDLLSGAENQVAEGARVTMLSLEMLLTIMSEAVLQIPDVAIKFYRLIVYLVEFSPEAMTEMQADLLMMICECLKTGMTSRFGVEVCSLSLEGVSNIAKFFSEVEHRQLIRPELVKILKDMLPLVFEACLEYSCENSLFTEASSALFTLIWFNRPVFDAFITELINSRNNATAVQHLQAAFTTLLEGEEITGTRRQRTNFRKRMEVFLNDIAGLLSIS